MDWFKNNGDKVLSTITGISALAATQWHQLHLNETAMAYVAFAGAIATLLHTVFYPNGANK